MSRCRILALLTALTLLSGCAVRERAQEEGFEVYFSVAQVGGPAVASERRSLPETADPAEALLSALFSGPLSEDLVSPFPDGMILRSVNRAEDGLLTVDVSERYGGLSGVDLTVADCCITLTLCQLPGVEAVTVTVEGEPIPFRDRQVLRPGDVLLSASEGEPVTITASLYYPTADGRLSIERRDVTVAEGISRSAALPAAVLAALLDGSTAGDLSLTLPQGTELLSVDLENNICYVNFSRPFETETPADEREARLLLYAIVDTLCALEGVDSVHLLVEGESLDTYGGVPVGAPLEADVTLAEEALS